MRKHLKCSVETEIEMNSIPYKRHSSNSNDRNNNNNKLTIKYNKTMRWKYKSHMQLNVSGDSNNMQQKQSSCVERRVSWAEDQEGSSVAKQPGNRRQFAAGSSHKPTSQRRALASVLRVTSGGQLQLPHQPLATAPVAPQSQTRTCHMQKSVQAALHCSSTCAYICSYVCIHISLMLQLRTNILLCFAAQTPARCGCYNTLSTLGDAFVAFYRALMQPWQPHISTLWAPQEAPQQDERLWQ